GARCWASSAPPSTSTTTASCTAFASVTASISRSRTSCRSASRPVSRCASTACSTPSARISRWRRRSAHGSMPSASPTRARRACRSPSSPGPPDPMSALAPERRSGREGLAPAFAAARARFGLVVLLLALAGIGWWWTIGQMRGMDDGPWTGLGSIGWFLAVWVVMMAAMMFPSVAPTVALYSRMTKARSPLAPLVFSAGYLVVWAAVGLLAFTIALIGGHLFGGVLHWSRAGRWVAGATLLPAG